MRLNHVVHGRSANDPAFRCCGCCHVQTGTICLGVYNLVTQVIAMSVLMVVILHPEMVHDSLRPMDALTDREFIPPKTKVIDNSMSAYSHIEKQPVPEGEVPPELPSPMPLRNSNYNEMQLPTQRLLYGRTDLLMFTKKRVESGDAHLALALVFALASITLLLVYGAIKGRAVYLLPFFCVQVFDFIFSCLTAVGHYSWLPNIHDVLISNPEIPFRDDLMRLNSQWVALTILVLYVMVLLVKAYCIGIIWSCYQFIQLKTQRVITYSGDSEEVLLPPTYSEATKLPKADVCPPSMFATPPPQYYTASE